MYNHTEKSVQVFARTLEFVLIGVRSLGRKASQKPGTNLSTTIVYVVNRRWHADWSDLQA